MGKVRQGQVVCLSGLFEDAKHFIGYWVEMEGEGGVPHFHNLSFIFLCYDSLFCKVTTVSTLATL